MTLGSSLSISHSLWEGLQNYKFNDINKCFNNIYRRLMHDNQNMITLGQMRAARALLQIDQRQLAELSGLSLPTIQRMEASEAVIRGNIDSFEKLIRALNAAGVELIGEGAASQGGGRGVRLSGAGER